MNSFGNAAVNDCKNFKFFNAAKYKPFCHLAAE